MDVRQGFLVSPGKCWCCGTADQSLWVLDTGRDDINTPQHWRVYLCQTCVLSSAQRIGERTGHVVMPMEALDRMERAVTESNVWRHRAEKAEQLLRDLSTLASEVPA